MIIILHGDHQVESRNRLIELKSTATDAGVEILSVDGGPAELNTLIQSLESTSLFSEKRLVIIENLLSGLRAGAKRNEIIGYLVKGAFDSDLILWEKGSVGRQIITLKKQKHVRVEEFKMPSAIFSFVDTMRPHNAPELLSSFHTVLEHNVVPEIVFSMIIRQFRLMIAVHTGASITETERLAPWQRSNIDRQLREYSPAQLKQHYKELLVTDFQLKTGKSPLNLTQRIEQFIIGL